MNTKNQPVCTQKRNACFAFSEGRCIVLKNTDFGERKCPFFKVHTQAQEEDIRRRQRLLALGLQPREVRGDGD